MVFAVLSLSAGLLTVVVPSASAALRARRDAGMLRVLGVAVFAAVVAATAAGCSTGSASAPPTASAPSAASSPSMASASLDPYLCGSLERMEQALQKREQQLSEGGAVTVEQANATALMGVQGVVVVLGDAVPAEVKRVAESFVALMHSSQTTTSDLTEFITTQVPILVDYGRQVCPAGS